MDREDMRLCRMLMMDSRMPYQDLATKLGMSVPAVHKRLTNLVEAGVIGAFTAEVDIAALGAAIATVAGKSNLKDVSAIVPDICKDGRTWLVLLGSDSTVFTFAHLRHIEDFEEYSRLVTSKASLMDVYQGVHVVSPGTARLIKPGDGQGLSPLERGIIRSLRYDSRKRASDVAKELGVTAKMVNKKISEMQDQRKVRFGIQWRPGYGKVIVTLVILDLPEGANIEAGISSLMTGYPDNVVFCTAFAQGRRSIMATVWTESMKEISPIVQGISSTVRALSATPHIVYASHFSTTWKDEYLITGRY